MLVFKNWQALLYTIDLRTAIRNIEKKYVIESFSG